MALAECVNLEEPQIICVRNGLLSSALVEYLSTITGGILLDFSLGGSRYVLLRGGYYYALAEWIPPTEMNNDTDETAVRVEAIATIPRVNSIGVASMITSREEGIEKFAGTPNRTK